MDGTSPLRASARFRTLLPAGVATSEWVGEGDPARLPAAERTLALQVARERACEFAAGRECARHAMAQLGMEEVALTVRGDRRPRWPRWLTGSITHAAGFSAAAVAPRESFPAIGIDAQRVDDVSAEIWRRVLRPEEARLLQRRPAPEQVKAAALAFSAKEAFYKCQYEVTEQWLEFDDVTVEFLDGPLVRGCFAVYPVGGVRLFEQGWGPVVGRFAFADDLVLTAMALFERASLPPRARSRHAEGDVSAAEAR